MSLIFFLAWPKIFNGAVGDCRPLANRRPRETGPVGVSMSTVRSTTPDIVSYSAWRVKCSHCATTTSFIHSFTHARTHTHTHTHTCSTALFLGLPGWAGTRKVKPIWILLKQETVSGSGISWAICKSAPHTRQPCQQPTTQFFTGPMHFLPPNQQRQGTEGITSFTQQN